jgi:hypothetical protein
LILGPGLKKPGISNFSSNKVELKKLKELPEGMDLEALEIE